MQVHVASDIHLEFDRIPTLAGGDLLILAGDTLVLADVTRKSGCWHAARSFFANEVSKYQRVLVLMGNHEHYHGVIDRSPDIYRSFLADVAPHARLLDNECEVIDGVAFVGSTLWAPCQSEDSPFSELAIAKRMNDFRMIATSDGSSKRKFTTADARKRHEAAVAFIQQETAKHNRCVVLTHHAPSMKSNTKYQASGYASGDDLTPAYCADLEFIMLDNPHISHWVHGHTHHNVDYTVGKTRVVSNQHGYWRMESIADGFDPLRAAFDTAKARNKVTRQRNKVA